MTTVFEEKVYEVTKRIPIGKVTTYKAIALVLDSSPRAVGNALRKNPYAPKVPCHRVISEKGTIGGFKGKIKGAAISEKIRMLKIEGIKFSEGKVGEEQILRKEFGD